MDKLLDFVGREIKAGQQVTYPVRRGSSMWLAKMNVQQVVPGKLPQISGFNDEGRRVTVRNVSLVQVIVPVEQEMQHADA